MYLGYLYTGLYGPSLIETGLAIHIEAPLLLEVGLQAPGVAAGHLNLSAVTLVVRVHLQVPTVWYSVTEAAPPVGLGSVDWGGREDEMTLEGPPLLILTVEGPVLDETDVDEPDRPDYEVAAHVLERTVETHASLD